MDWLAQGTTEKQPHKRLQKEKGGNEESEEGHKGKKLQKGL